MTEHEPAFPLPASGATLPRRLGLITATSVVVANMIGTGIFTTTGLMLGHTESGWLVLLAWLLGGLVALAGALSYAELATMMPHAGGEYVYLREIYGPLPGFLTGWTSFFVGFSAPVAASAVACAKYLTAAGVLRETWLAEKTAAAGIVLALTAVHYCGLRLGARVQNLLTGLKLALLFGLVAVGFAIGRGSWDFLGPASGFWAAGRPGQLGVTLLLVMFAYSGWNAAGYIAEEVEDPARTLPRSLLLGTLIVMLIYLLVNLLLFFAALPAQLRGIVPVGEVAAVQLFGPGAAAMISTLIGLALLSSLSAYVLIGPRVYYAMARDALFFRFAARVHPRFHTPGLSILAQGACSVAMILTGTFEQLLTYIGFALGIFPVMAVAGVFMLRRRQPARERPYRVWGYPLTPVFFLVMMLAILAVGFVNAPKPSLIALATVAAGMPAYWLTNWLAVRRASRSRR
ncbi:MAG: amino acid permease [Acidobacteria bacterium]|nr:amino acid permease [Acidobacteriota bacterium]MBI3662454.1 amino acid permease [Acidobacteriota bacterium]